MPTSNLIIFVPWDAKGIPATLKFETSWCTIVDVKSNYSKQILKIKMNIVKISLESLADHHYTGFIGLTSDVMWQTNWQVVKNDFENQFFLILEYITTVNTWPYWKYKALFFPKWLDFLKSFNKLLRGQTHTLDIFIVSITYL